MTAWIATVGQLATALEIMRTESPSADPRYLWAVRFVVTNGKAVLAQMSDPKARTQMATEARELTTAYHRRRAAELRRNGLKVREIARQMAAEAGHPTEPFTERSVGRWLAPIE